MARREIVTNAGELADVLNELLDDGVDDSDCIRITQHGGELRAGVVTNEPADGINPDCDDEDADELPLPVYNNKRFARDLKLLDYMSSDDDDEDDDCLDLPQYNPAAFKIR